MKRILSLLCALTALVLLAGGCAAETGGIEIPDIQLKTAYDIPDTEGLRFVRELKTGWNLGNTFDANDPGSWFHGSEVDIESMWCGVKTSRELIRAIREAGFGVIRIPVSWHDHVDENDNVSAEWLARVKEVVGWAVEEGLYVIVNVHHDNKAEFFYPDTAHLERSKAYLSAVWRQMAETLAEFDDHVILESLNEPRLAGRGAIEWNFDETHPDCIDAANCINELNQLFVDTVRATGGNNATRYLLIPGYSGSLDGVKTSLFRMPEDTAEGRLIIECHAYWPYDFALNLNNRADVTFELTDTAKTGSIDYLVDTLYTKFVSQGIPVLLDEYGALNKGGNLQARVNHAAYYVAAASARGITCCYWDNHNFSGNGEQFGLIDRKTCEWKYPEIVEAIMLNCMKGR